MSVRAKPKPAESEHDGSELPEGWATTTLDTLFDFKYGKGLRQDTRDGTGVVSVYGSNGVVGKHASAVTSGPTIIVGRKGSVGEVHLCPEPCWPIDTTYFIDEFPCDLPPIYWKNFLKSLRLGDQEKSSAIPGISRDDIYKVTVPVPPLAEQQRIVGKLELLLGKVSSSQQRLSRVPGLLKRFRQSVLAAACSGKLTADWREDHPNTPAYEADLPTDSEARDDELPSNWLKTTLGPLIELVTSGSRGWAKYYADSGFLFIRAQNINSDVLRLDDVAFVRLPNKAEGLRTRVQKNDILVTITGANVTKSALVDRDLDDAYVSQHVALVRLTDRRLAPFLFHWIVSTAHGRKQLLESAYGQGKPGLNLDNIRDIAIALPPLSEQQEIVRRVKKLFVFGDQIEARLRQVQTRVDCLTQSLLAKAFRGELVPTEHALATAQGHPYESASELLARIVATGLRVADDEKVRSTKGRRTKSST